MSQLKWAFALLLVVVSFACTEKTQESAPDVETDGAGLTNAADPDGGTPIEDVVEDVTDSVEDAVGGSVDDAAAGAMEVAKTKADDLIAQIKSYIGEDKVDMAKQTLEKLVALQDQLPSSYQEKIQQMRELIDSSGLVDQAKKLGGGLGLGGD